MKTMKNSMFYCILILFACFIFVLLDELDKYYDINIEHWIVGILLGFNIDRFKNWLIN